MAAPFDRQAGIAFVVVTLLLLIAGFGFNYAIAALDLYLRKYPVELRRPLSLVSTTIGDWKATGPDRIADAIIIEALGTDKYLDRNYAKAGETQAVQFSLHLAFYTGMIDTVPHVPDRCLVAAGFTNKGLPVNLPLPFDSTGWLADPEGLENLATGQTYSVVYHRDMTGDVSAVRMPVGELKLRTIEFEREANPGLKIFGGYFFIANGRVTPSPEGVKLLAFDPREKYAYYCKVQYLYASVEATEELFLEAVADHLKGLLPELMRCLPDWSEVERRTSEVESGQGARSPMS